MSVFLSVFDGIYIFSKFEDAIANRKTEMFIDEAYNHYKPIGFGNTGMIKDTYKGHPGIETKVTEFLQALKAGPHFDRPLAIG